MEGELREKRGEQQDGKGPVKRSDQSARYMYENVIIKPITLYNEYTILK